MLQFDARPLGVPSMFPDGRTHRHPGGWRCASKGRLLMSEDCFFSSTQARPLGIPSLRPDGQTRHHPGGCRCASKGRLLMSGGNFFGSTQGLRASRPCPRTVEHAATGRVAVRFPKDDCECRVIISSVRRKAFGRPVIVPGRSNTPPPGRVPVRFQGTIVTKISSVGHNPPEREPGRAGTPGYPGGG